MTSYWTKSQFIRLCFDFHNLLKRLFWNVRECLLASGLFGQRSNHRHPFPSASQKNNRLYCKQIWMFRRTYYDLNVQVDEISGLRRHFRLQGLEALTQINCFRFHCTRLDCDLLGIIVSLSLLDPTLQIVYFQLCCLTCIFRPYLTLIVLIGHTTWGNFLLSVVRYARVYLCLN